MGFMVLWVSWFHRIHGSMSYVECLWFHGFRGIIGLVVLWVSWFGGFRSVIGFMRFHWFRVFMSVMVSRVSQFHGFCFIGFMDEYLS